MSDVAHLIKVLVDIARDIEQRIAQGGKEARDALAARVKYLMEDVPELPNFSRFEDVFRERRDSATTEGDMRAAFYAAYDPAGCEHVKLASKVIDERLEKGPELVSANFVIPYPPGFPIMVPGQVITAETIEFMQARCQRDPRLQRRARARPETVGVGLHGKRKSKND